MEQARSQGWSQRHRMGVHSTLTVENPDGIARRMGPRFGVGIGTLVCCWGGVLIIATMFSGT
jgi:hypothetical protein